MRRAWPWCGGVAAILFVALGPLGAQAAPRVVVRDSAAYTVLNLPAATLDVSEHAQRLVPSGARASTGTYTHPGLEFGLVVSGTVARWEGGQTRSVRAGGAFVSPPGESVASSASASAVLIDAFLTPRASVVWSTAPGLPAAPLVSGIFRRTFPVDEVPPIPFTLVEQLIDIGPGASTIRFAYGARAFVTVAEGTVTLERSGSVSRYGLGQGFALARGETLRFANATARPASVMVVLLLPEAVRLTEPHHAYW